MAADNATAGNRYLALYGAELMRAGYEILPLRSTGDTKRPLMDNWELIRSDERQLAQWLHKGYATCGVGIPSKFTVGVDVDCLDRDVSKSMGDWIQGEFGLAPVRIGQAPKRLLIYRPNEPFAKVSSPVFLDEWMQEHRLEILGDGQQFVAFATHPKTKKPFVWLDQDGPLITHHDELPVITRIDALGITEEFTRRAKSLGWIIKPSAQRVNGHSPNAKLDYSDPFISDSPPVELTLEQIQEKLFKIPNDPLNIEQSYDVWCEIGMGLYHQYSGGDDGYELWRSWSEQSSKHIDAECERKWPSFNVGADRQPTTARFILKLANEIEATERKELFAGLDGRFAEAATVAELRAVAAEVKRIAFDPFERSDLMRAMRKRYKKLTGEVMPIGDARDLTRYINPDRKLLPSWLEPYVFVSSINKWYSRRTRTALDTQAFNTAYQGELLTEQQKDEGQARTEMNAADFAIMSDISRVDALMYMPGHDELFELEGRHYCNTYSDINVPEMPEKYSDADREAVEVFKAHFVHLLVDDFERKILCSWLAYIVQNPGKHVNWSVILQGTEGDGKTWFFELMGAILGSDNVFAIDPSVLNSEFTSWAAGHQLGFFEEIKVATGRYDVLNKLKPFLTNKYVSERKMRTDIQNVLNTQSYLFATNFPNALPIGTNDRRYFALRSRWQTADELRVFMTGNPSYYKRLYGILGEHAGALRKFLLNYKLAPAFDPVGHAPESISRTVMQIQEEMDDVIAIRTAVAEGDRPELNPELLCASLIHDCLPEQVVMPEARRLGMILSDIGYSALGQHRIRLASQDRTSWWAREPRRFFTNGKPDTQKIRRFLKAYKPLEATSELDGL